MRRSIPRWAVTELDCRPPAASGSRAERDTLLQENDDLRARCEQMMQQVEELTTNLVGYYCSIRSNN